MVLRHNTGFANTDFFPASTPGFSKTNKGPHLWVPEKECKPLAAFLNGQGFGFKFGSRPGPPSYYPNNLEIGNG